MKFFLFPIREDCGPEELGTTLDGDGGSVWVWEDGLRTPQQRPRYAMVGKQRGLIYKAWSGVCQETKLIQSENTREEQSEEIKKKSYECNETLSSTTQTWNNQGQDRALCELGQEQLQKGVARAIPQPRIRCTLGDREKRGQGTRPAADALHSFSRAATTKYHKQGGLQ